MLVDFLATAGELGFTEAAQRFGVSEMTIRRDVEALEEQHLVRRVPGGVIATQGYGYEPPFASRVQSRSHEKEHIARTAAELLAPGERVLIDVGSTALAVAKAIRGRGLGLTVLTPGLLVAMELVEEPDTVVFMTGGELRRGDMSLVGAEAVASLASYNVDTFIMGVSGVDAERGVSDVNPSEAAKKRVGVASSNRVILCVDSSKLNSIFFAHVADLAEIDVLVTDGDPGDRTIEAARRAGVEVLLAESPTLDGFTIDEA